MADGKKSLSARSRASRARAELADRRRKQTEIIEQHQLAFFEADKEVVALEAKIEDLRARISQLQDEQEQAAAATREQKIAAMGALVIEAEQPVGDVAVLLDVSPAEVKKAASIYRARRKEQATASSASPPDPDQPQSDLTEGAATEADETSDMAYTQAAEAMSA